MTEYRVTWGGTWSEEKRTFTDYEKAVEWARMKKAMNNKVKLEKLEVEELEF